MGKRLSLQGVSNGLEKMTRTIPAGVKGETRVKWGASGRKRKRNCASEVLRRAGQLHERTDDWRREARLTFGKWKAGT